MVLLVERAVRDSYFYMVCSCARALFDGAAPFRDGTRSCVFGSAHGSLAWSGSMKYVPKWST